MGQNAQTGLGFATTAGVAVDSGLVFGGTFGNQLVALNASTGSLVWSVPIDQGIVANPQATYIGPEAAPLVFDHEVIIGNIQGNSAARGFVRAFSESSGALLWTFYTVPASPVDTSNQGFYKNSWGACTYCGGGDLWSIPAVDPSSGVIYFGTGDASPSFNASQRSPSQSYPDLYTDCIIALNATNGNMIWYYQTVPADVHNWDPGMPVQLFNTTINGAKTLVVGEGSKSGFYYELDAKNGTLLHETELGIHLNDNEAPKPSGSIVYPGTFGGVNTFSSFDPTTNMIYTMTYNWATNYTSGPITLNGQGGVDNVVPGTTINSTLYAIDASTGSVVWSVTLPGLGGGVSSTNDLVFTSDGQSNFYAYNASSGARAWSYNNGRGNFNDGLANWGPPSVVDGMLFETSVANDGGVFAFRPQSSSSLSSTTSSTSTTSSVSSGPSSTTTTMLTSSRESTSSTSSSLRISGTSSATTTSITTASQLSSTSTSTEISTSSSAVSHASTLASSATTRNAGNVASIATLVAVFLVIVALAVISIFLYRRK